MLFLALFVACVGHADPPEEPGMVATGVALELADGREISAAVAQVAPGGDGVARDVVAKDGALEIEAPHTEWDLRSRTAILSGGVTARRGPVVLECTKMEVNFSSPGRVERAIALGAVRVRHGERSGRAERAVLTTVDGRITLTGSPVLADGANQMSGDRIVLHMDEDKVLCDGCRMTIASDAVTPGAGSK